MGERTSIEWAANVDGTPGATWNPIRAIRIDAQGEALIGTHCVHVSEGCRNCYAERMNMRMLPGNGTGLPYAKQSEAKLRIFLDERMLAIPLRRRKPTTYFLSSMSDVFADFVIDDMLDRLFAVMALSPQHTFIVLTKRAARMRAYCSTLGGHHERDRVSLAMKALDAELDLGGQGAWYTLRDGGAFFPNICLGVSVEDQPTADERIPHLLATPARWRAVSAEPLLGSIESFRYIRLQRRVSGDLGWLDGSNTHALAGVHRCYYNPHGARSVRANDGKLLGIKPHECADLPTIDWLICGGESGPNARPMHPAWARALRDQCADAGVPFFFKQWGEHTVIAEVDGASKEPRDVRHWLRDPTVYRALEGPRDSKVAFVKRVGKARAGRLLDGVEHNARPAFFEVEGRKGEALATRPASPGRTA